METVTKDKSVTIYVMVKASIFTLMAATILETGSRERCKVRVNYSIAKEIFSMKDNGRTIISKVRASYIISHQGKNG